MDHPAQPFTFAISKLDKSLDEVSFPSIRH
jgi:hypothetical protein